MFRYYIAVLIISVANAHTLTRACGGVQTGNEGEILSPNYPAVYPSNADCYYEISANAPIELIFHYFNLNTGVTCADYIEIFDGSTTMKYCGTETPPATYSTGNKITIQFMSDEYITEFTGFNASWTTDFIPPSTEAPSTTAAPFTPGPNCVGQEFFCDFEQYDCYCLSNVTTDDYDWQYEVGSTISLNTGPDVDHTLGTAQGHYVYADASNIQPGYTTILQTGPVYQSVDVCVNFWYHMYGESVGDLIILRQDLDTGSVTQFWTQNGNQGEMWKNAKVTITQGSSRYRVLISAVRGEHYQGDIAIDDFDLRLNRC